MEKHTFKVGDRVIFTSCVGPGKSNERKGVILSEDSQYYYVLRDDGERGITNPPGWTACKNETTTHDTNFQVGDWVRYEGIYSTNTPKLNGRIGKIERIDNGELAYVPDFCPLASGSVFLENLVKIQPPKEAQVDTVKIKHKKYGIVEGVNVLQGGLDHGFTKDGAHYFVGNGWSQVPEVEWVTIQVEKNGFDRLKMYENVYGYSDKTFMDNEYTKWRYPQ